MALKLRKDIKKSSYYVWFLGAKESKGLRGPEYILPVIKNLEEREKDIEPFKVTLQVSHKGLKIIQNVVVSQPNSKLNAKPKNETIKHFIPHNTITCCYQHEDVIACILLLFNPVTKCPLHVHAYRCDSLETASLLKQQLQILIDRPENQKKFAEIESRLRPPPIQEVSKKIESSVGSDTGTSTRESESSEERYGLEPAKVTTLYDSVAAELREKLSKNNVPILLPPRDYDTVHRQKGNLTGIELRRCLNTNIVGQNVNSNNNNNNTNNNRRLESSGGSSGIGSDHPPSPDSPDTSDMRFNTTDNHSTSDEDWNGDPAESTIYLMHGPPQVTLPRPGSRDGTSENTRFSRYVDKAELTKYLEQPIAKYADNKYLEKQKPKQRSNTTSKRVEETRESYQQQQQQHHHQQRYSESNYRHFGDSRDEDNRRYGGKEEQRKSGGYEKGMKYFDDDGFDENLRYRIKMSETIPKVYSHDSPKHYQEKFSNAPIPRTRQKLQAQSSNDSNKYYKSSTTPQSYTKSTSPSYTRHLELENEEEEDEERISFRHHHRRSPSPPSSPEEIQTSQRDRFKDAKQKFLTMEREELHAEPLISPIVMKEKPFLKRHESMAAFEARQRGSPHRNSSSEVKYRHDMEWYRVNKYEPKRHSMLNLIEEEHKRHSNEIAQEIKRRSYMEKMKNNNNISKSTIDLNQHHHQENVDKYGKINRGYRHSYAEPKTKVVMEKDYNSSRGSRKKNFDGSSRGGGMGSGEIHPY